MFRRLTAAFEIPIFNRIVRINHNYKDLNQIPLGRAVVAQMPALDQVSVIKQGVPHVAESDVQLAEELVPPCRLGSVDTTKNKIRIKVHPGSAMACAAN